MSNQGILVSVIVLTYNHEKYIRQALDSILMQRVDFQYEILVGDDASTDSTQEILKEYDRNYPGKSRLFLRESNLGPTKNSYELLVSAKRDYPATCEGADYWKPFNVLACLSRNSSFGATISSTPAALPYGEDTEFCRRSEPSNPRHERKQR